MTGAAEKLRAVTLATLMVTSLFAVVPGVAAAAGNTGGNTGNDGGTDLDGPGPAGMVGSGTESDPYVITTVDQLQAMEQDLDAYYVLGNDIDASETAGWNEGRGFDPVGSESTEFTGNFDGHGHTITNLTIDRPTASNVGLFGYAFPPFDRRSSENIVNVTLTNVSVVGNESVGALVGESLGVEHQHVRVQGTVTGNKSVGGILGRTRLAPASNVSADVTVSGRTVVGGIVGWGQLRLEHSSVTGSVDGETAVGGAVGYLDEGETIETVSSTATVDGSTEVGGLVGLQAGEIRRSSATGTVTGETDVGGLVGDARDNIDDSWANGTVTGNTNVGGLAGQASDNVIRYSNSGFNSSVLLSNVSTTGNVTGEDAVGGLVGELTGGETFGSGEWRHDRIDNASATGAVVGNTNTGGLVGVMRASETGAPRIQDSWANGNITTTTKTIAEAYHVGGLVGYVDAGTVERVWANATLDAADQVGGLVGRSDGTIRNASSATDVRGIYDTGGLVGNNSGTVVDSTASTVFGAGSVGGLAGRNYGTIRRSSATGPVLGGFQYVGGLVGRNYGTITDSWAVGLVGNTNEVDYRGDSYGGVIGTSYGATEDTLYWDRNATNRSVGVGSKVNGGTIENVTGLTTAEMTGAAAASNMSRLDFTNTWATTNRYPQLAVEPAFDVTVTGTNEPVTAGENLTVTAAVTNTGDVADRQAIWLTDTGFTDTEQDSVDVVLETGQSTTISLNWSTDADDVGDGAVTVTSPDDSASRTVTVDEPVVGTGPAGMVGSGTDGDPYVITNATQLQAMEQDLDAYYALGNDIDASETAGWNEGKGFEPVGNNSNVFIGEFDGRGHTISNLTIDRPTENDVGLFGLKRGSAAAIDAANDVENVTLTNVSVVGNEFVGALVGRSGAAYHQHVHVQGTVTGNESVGGIVGGSGQSSIRNVSANVTVSGTKYIGGVIGFGDVFRILDSSVTGSVDGEMAVGGAVGYLDNSDVTENVSSTATVDGSSEVGGLVGLQEGLIRNSSASGTVSGETNVGGLVGDARGDIVDSRANGTVTGDTSVGGLVGQVTDETTQYADLDISPDALLSNVSATGTVTGDDAVGGLVGELSGKETSGSGEWEHGRIDNASSTGAVAGNTDTGGLVGMMRASESGSPRIQDSWANGSVTTPLSVLTDVGNIGGLVGYLQDGTVERVWVNTSIDAEEAVGGLVGRSEGTIRDASATGDVDSGLKSGGLVGNNTGTVTDSTASATVTGTRQVGGLAGANYGTVTRSSSTGAVLAGQQFVGGLIGASLGTTTDSWAVGLVSNTDDNPGGVIGASSEATEETLYWDRNATTLPVGVGTKANGGSIENVTGLTTAEMTGSAAASNMSRLDFANTWATTNRYPQLAFEPAFDVRISGTTEPVTAGENLTVTAAVTNTGDVADQQAVWLTAGGQERTRTTAVLEPGQSTTVSLDWSTDTGDVGNSEVTVWSPDDSASRTVTVDEPVAEPVVDPDASTVTATSPNVADGSDAATVTATVVDENGDPLTGLTAADFDISVGGDATVASGVTETNAGVYEFTLTDNTAETVSVAVTADGVALTDEPTVEFVTAETGAFFDVTITGTNTPVRAGNDVTVTVDVTNVGDTAGTQTVTATVGSQRDAAPVTLDPGASTTVELSWATAAVDEGGMPVTVASANASDRRTLTILAPLADPSDSTVDVTSPHVANGSDPATVTVTLVNESGQPVTGLDASAFAFSFDDTTATSDIVETSPGVYELTATSETVGSDSFTVTVDGIILFETPVLEFSEPSTALFKLAGVDTNAPVPAGETLSVTATVTNTGNTADSQTVTLTDTGFADTEQDAVDVTLDPGASETVTLEWVTDDGDIGSGLVTVASDNTSATRSVTVEPAVDADASAVTASSPHLADGSDAATVTATVVDTNGDPVTGLTAADFGLSVGDATVGSGPTETNAGVYEFTVTDDTAETVPVTVTARGVALTDEPSVEFVDPPAAFFDVNITGTNTPVRAGRTVTVTANVTNVGERADTQELAISTSSATFDRDATNVSLDPGESTTVELGWKARSYDEGEIVVTVASENASDTRSVTIRQPRVSFVASDIDVTSPHVANGEDAATVTVTLRNQSDRTPVTGVDPADFDIDAGDATVDNGVTETSPGVYEFTLTSTESGLEAVAVYAEGIQVIDQETVASPKIEFVEPGTAYFDVAITETSAPVPVGDNERLTVTANVTNRGEVAGTETVRLVFGSGSGSGVPPSQRATVTLGPGESNSSVDLVWQRQGDVTGFNEVSVESDDDAESQWMWVDVPPEEPTGTLATMAGNGTVGNPYVITNVTQLQAMAQDTHAHYVLGNDIDASNTSTWNDGKGFEPVGDFVYQTPIDSFGLRAFTASFDGRNHTITNLTIDRPGEIDVGLFGVTQYARVENVVLVGGNVTGGDYVGALVGYQAGSTISEAGAAVPVTGTDAVGGLLGGNSGTLWRSYATGTVTANDGTGGGLVGVTDQLSLQWYGPTAVTQSYATGAVRADTANPLLASPDDTLAEVYATGAVDSPDNSDADATVTAAYWDSLTTGRSQFPYGEALETPQLTGRAATANLNGFDFATTWLATDGYPRLRWSLESVAVSPSTVTVDDGNTTRAAVTASFVDGTTETATTTATYTSNDTDVVTVGDDGVITAVGAGTATVTATVGGQQASTTVTVRPGSTGGSSDGSTSGGSAGGSSGGGAAGGSAGGTGSESDETDDTVVTVEPMSEVDGGWTASVVGARTGQPVNIAFGDGEGGPSVSVSDLRLNVSRESDFSLDLIVTDDTDDQNFTAATGAVSMGTVTINHAIPDADIDEATVTLRVDSERLSAAGVDPAAVALYRQEGANWTRLPTRVVETTDGSHVFEAVSPGLSVFTVGADTTQSMQPETPVETATPTESAVTDSPPTSSPGPTATTDGSGPGMGLLTALLAVALVAFRARRAR
jgi:uncharacterized membrane protein